MAASSDNYKKGWMGIQEFNRKDDIYIEDNKATGIRIVDERSKQLEGLFSKNEWTKLCTHHNVKTYNRERTLYHWLGLGDESIDQSVIQYRKQLLLSLWDNKVFHPFVDITKAEEKIVSSKYKIWVLRLSTTEPGKLTFSYPKKMDNDTLMVKHYRINNVGGQYTVWDNKYNTIDDVIKIITLTIQGSMVDSDIEADPYEH